VDCFDQIPRCCGFRQHRIGQGNAERLSEAEQRFYALEAADAQIAVECFAERRLRGVPGQVAGLSMRSSSRQLKDSRASYAASVPRQSRPR
jgi:hypothetical protein